MKNGEPTAVTRFFGAESVKTGLRGGRAHPAVGLATHECLKVPKQGPREDCKGRGFLQRYPLEGPSTKLRTASAFCLNPLETGYPRQ